MSETIVVIGGGHAAAQLCAALVEQGQGSRVVLVCEEPVLPYQRPPLSKTYLKNPAEKLQLHRAAAWYEQAGIQVRVGDPAVAIDRTAHTVRLRSGETLDWGRLVLATGTRVRWLSEMPPELDNVVALRSAEQALRVREALEEAEAVTVLGGGFIGLEVAATALILGRRVTVLEAAPRLLGRAVSQALSDFVVATHRESGMDVRLNARVSAPVIEGSRLASLNVDGETWPIDLLLKGIGAVPEVALAETAGLECADGIVVDAFMQTSDPAILAIGDCTAFPDALSGRHMRLESVQNANDQARTAAATLMGQPRAHAAVPWFWSDQGRIRLQMVGLMPAADTPGLSTVRRPGAQPGAFSLIHHVGDALRCVETVNAPADHLACRKLFELGRHPTPEQMADVSLPLKHWLN